MSYLDSGIVEPFRNWLDTEMEIAKIRMNFMHFFFISNICKCRYGLIRSKC